MQRASTFFALLVAAACADNMRTQGSLADGYVMSAPDRMLPCQKNRYLSAVDGEQGGPGRMMSCQKKGGRRALSSLEELVEPRGLPCRRMVGADGVEMMDCQGAAGQQSASGFEIPSSVVGRRLNLVRPDSRPQCNAQGCGPSVATARAVVVQRDTVTTVVRETSCPDGMSLEGTVCVGLDICPVQYTCPSGFVEGQYGGCVTDRPPVVECPRQYTLRAGKICSRSHSSPADYVCDQPGYDLDGASRVCIKEVPQPGCCPAGFTMEGSSCVQKYPPQPRCAPGQTFSPQTKECVSSFTEPAVLNCPDGAQQVDSQRCVAVSQAAPYCPSRYSMDGASCVQNVPKIKGECPTGFTRTGRGCERVERSPAEHICPQNDSYELRGEVCYKEIPQESRCPQGTQKSSFVPDTCEKCIPPKPTCTEGTLRGEQCVVEVEQPSKECCAPGFKLEGSQCTRVEVTPPKISCEGECYTSHSYPVAYACPLDSEFVADPVRPKCVRQSHETVCAPVEPPQCSADAASRGECGVRAPVVVAPSCNDRVSNEVVAAEPYCPNGGSFEDGRCVTREPIVPTRSCPVGTYDEATQSCTRTTTSPLQFECPAGSVRQGKHCFTKEVRPATYVCPEGSEETAAGVCTVRTDAIPVPNKVQQIPATPTCPQGSVLSGKQCLFTSTAELPEICPAGSQETYNGCQKTAPLVVPPVVEKQVRPSFYCASQSASLSGRSCTVVERTSPELTCANDSFLQQNQCVRTAALVEKPPKRITAAPRPVCSVGKLAGSVCIETEEFGATTSCTTGFELNGERCEKYAEKTPLCPIGTTLQGEGCVRRVEVAPTVRVINGCEVAPQKAPVCYKGY